MSETQSEIQPEIEVYRLSKFDKNKYYEYALCTRHQGNFYMNNEKYYTKNTLLYVGNWIKSERWGVGDGSGGCEIFNDNGIIKRIEYDYSGKTCFREVPSLSPHCKSSRDCEKA